MKRITRSVPCNGCTACCRGFRDFLEIDPQYDNALDYKTRPIGKTLVLDWDDQTGDCKHLTPAGCEVWNRRPIVCREFDCRLVFDFPVAVQKRISAEVREAARRILREEGKL